MKDKEGKGRKSGCCLLLILIGYDLMKTIKETKKETFRYAGEEHRDRSGSTLVTGNLGLALQLCSVQVVGTFATGDELALVVTGLFATGVASL